MKTRKNTHLHIGDRVTVYCPVENIHSLFRTFNWDKIKDCEIRCIRGQGRTHALYGIFDGLVLFKGTDLWFPVTPNFRRRIVYHVTDFKCLFEGIEWWPLQQWVVHHMTSSEQNWLNMYAHRKSIVGDDSSKQDGVLCPMLIAFKEKSDRNTLLTDGREAFRMVGLKMK